LAPGSIGGSTHQPGSAASVGSSPARAREDLPLPDAPSTSISPALFCAGERNSAAGTYVHASSQPGAEPMT
jgi:hypothetical protein